MCVADADIQPYRLICRTVRAGNNLAVCLLARHPDLDIVFLCRNRSDIAGADIDDMIRQTQHLEEVFGVL